MAKSKKQTAPADFYVGFTGNHGQRDVDEPSLGQEVEYTVFGTVTGRHETIRDDGETRYSYSVSVEAVWPKGGSRPDNANQASMVDHNGQVDPEAAGESGELIDTSEDPDAEHGDTFSHAGK